MADDRAQHGSGGQRRRGGKPGARAAGAGQGGNAQRGRGGRGRGGPGGQSGPGGQQSPLEVAVRSARNALRRHAESVRDDQSQLACRSLLQAVHGATGDVDSPAELLVVVEQTAHVLESSRRDDAQLPVTLRAVVAFALDTPRRARDVAEMLRLFLRYGYAVSADYVPRQLRDDGAFRASALSNVVEELAREYLDDARFAELTR